MFPGLCGCKAAATTYSQGSMGEDWEEKAERLRLCVCFGFLRKTKHDWQMLQDLSYKAYQIKINLLISPKQ